MNNAKERDMYVLLNHKKVVAEGSLEQIRAKVSELSHEHHQARRARAHDTNARRATVRAAGLRSERH
jgi:hypothetical protein